jgi:hypothetical protein
MAALFSIIMSIEFQTPNSIIKRIPALDFCIKIGPINFQVSTPTPPIPKFEPMMLLDPSPNGVNGNLLKQK